MSLTETVAEGDLKASLEALRDQLAKELEEGAECKRCGGVVSSPTPALAKQLRDVLTQLAGMKVPKRSARDELKQKRDEKLAGLG